jgi:Helicase conserved C-terminal domain
MSYYADYWNPSRDPRTESEKAWLRSKATPWDARWHALSHPARLAFLTRIKGATRDGSRTQPSTPANQVPAPVLEELVAAGFVEVEPGSGKKPGRVVPISATHDFSTRVRGIHRYQLLGKSHREDLAKYVKYAFFGQGEPLIARVLAKAGLQDYPRLEEGLEIYVTSSRWPGWAVNLAESKAARPLLEALTKRPGPVRLAEVPALVPSARPAELEKALEELIAHLTLFEDLDPKTLDLVVGLLPIVRERVAEAGKPRARPPLIVCDKPKEIGPQAGTVVNDLRVFLLEVAGESPRLRQDAGIFQKDVPRFEAALPPWPDWLTTVLSSPVADRVEHAYRFATTFKFVEAETEERQSWLRLTGKGRNWLAAGLEEQYRLLYESLRAYSKKGDHYDYGYDATTGDALFLGVSLMVSEATGSTTSQYYSYQQMKPEQRQAQRDAIYRALEALPVGVFHLCQSVFDHVVFGDQNPLIGGRDPSKLTIHLNQRSIPRLPERQEQAGKLLLNLMFQQRLLPFDAFRAAIDDQGRLCVARLPRFDGYFGRRYDSGDEAGSVGTRVIVQPDFSVVIIGLDPAPAAELATFCERVKGHLGEGAITFRITRDSVIRATSQGLSGSAIVARLQKYASVAVPENVLREVREWAGWVRLVNVRQVTVVRCPDSGTVDRVVGALGKKAERLGGTLVALHVPKLSSLERNQLKSQGILVTKDDIGPTAPEPSVDKPAVTPKKRGRPRKVR